MKNMYKIGYGLKMIQEIGNGGGGVRIHGGKIKHVLLVIIFGINIRRKLICLKLKGLIC